MTGEKYIDVDGIKTRYFEKGSGLLVVLFHGGHFGSRDAADCAEDWSLNFDGLVERFHVFAVDKIGQGFTVNPQAGRELYDRGRRAARLWFFKNVGIAQCSSRWAFARTPASIGNPAA